MQRLKIIGDKPTSRPSGNQPGNWLAGIMIGSIIITIATQAFVLGASAAIRDATIKSH